MEPDHYLHLGRLRMGSSVYRYVSLADLFRMFDTKQNGLRRPGSWKDPFENFMLNAYIENGTAEPDRFEWRDRVFAQCWTVERDSDAMWQIFCKDPDTTPGVRIRTTIGKLGSSLASALQFGERQMAYIGRVQYLRDHELMPRAEELFHGGVDPRRVAESLLIKRRSFRHEREVRLVTRALWLEAEGDFLNYSIDPHALIDSIIIDPRVSRERQLRLKEEIRDRTGYRGELLWSVLYDAPSYLRLHIWDLPTG